MYREMRLLRDRVDVIHDVVRSMLNVIRLGYGKRGTRIFFVDTAVAQLFLFMHITSHIRPIVFRSEFW